MDRNFMCTQRMSFFYLFILCVRVFVVFFFFHFRYLMHNPVLISTVQPFDEQQVTVITLE